MTDVILVLAPIFAVIGAGLVMKRAGFPGDGFWQPAERLVWLSRLFPENTASRALCARFGFREVGVYEKHAQLDGVWRDVVIVERLLGPASR